MTTPLPNPTTDPPNPTSTRFTLELEFVLSLANPHYLSHLATLTTPPYKPSSATTNNPHSQSQSLIPSTRPVPLLSDPRFLAYLKYLLYWTRPEYAPYLTHPGPALRNLRLLQQEAFRSVALRPDVVQALEVGVQELDGQDGNDGANKEGEEGAAVGSG